MLRDQWSPGWPTLCRPRDPQRRRNLLGYGGPLDQMPLEEQRGVDADGRQASHGFTGFEAVTGDKTRLHVAEDQDRRLDVCLQCPEDGVCDLLLVDGHLHPP